MRYIRSLLPVAAALLLACEVPINPTEDTPDPATRIEGTVQVLVSNGLPLGPTVLTRYACDDPPPPAGSGRPIDFLILPEEDYDDGVAAFTFPSVPPETCSLLAGFIDRDRDFHYALTVTGQASAGDVMIGAAQVVTEAADGDWVEPITDVRLRAEDVVEYDRPAFEIVPWEIPLGDDDDSADDGGGETAEVMPFMEIGPEPGTTAPAFMQLRVTTFVTDLLEIADPTFSLVFGTDEDGDGFPDDDNGDTAPDVDQPRVLLFKLDPEDPSLEADPPIVLPGVVMSLDPTDPYNPATNLVMQAIGAGIPFDGVAQMQQTAITIAVPPLVITSTDPLLLTPIEAVAASGAEVTGLYRVMVMNPNGQLWYLPNELGALGLADQAATFTVTDDM
jgi:hypothetical protein